LHCVGYIRQIKMFNYSKYLSS